MDTLQAQSLWGRRRHCAAKRPYHALLARLTLPVFRQRHLGGWRFVWRNASKSFDVFYHEPKRSILWSFGISFKINCWACNGYSH